MVISDFSGSHWMAAFTSMLEPVTGMSVNKAGTLYENGEVWLGFVGNVTLELVQKARLE